MTYQSVEQVLEKIVPRSQSRVRKIAVFLPLPYRGGSLRGAKNIAKMIHLGSREQNEPVDIVFSCYQNSYDIKEAFSDLLELGIKVRETNWKKISKNELEFIGNFRKIPKSMPSEEFLLPTDGINNFSDCDFWLLISDRTDPPLAPIVPYGIVVYDYIQRYVPELLGAFFEKSCFETARNASFMITTTPHTQGDAIQYAGMDPKKVSLFPMDFHPPYVPDLVEPVHDKQYFLWVTNMAVHKNHCRAFQALDRFFKEEKSELDVLIIGCNTIFLKDSSSNEASTYARGIAELIEKNPLLKKRCRILGEVTDREFSEFLSQAKFLWHPALIDNGTFSVVEAAYLNVPSLSSVYPAMKYINERFHLNLLFSNATDVTNMVQKLMEMNHNSEVRKQFLPHRQDLEKHSAKSLAEEFWLRLRQNLFEIGL